MSPQFQAGPRIGPEAAETARRAAAEALDRAADRLPKDEDLTVECVRADHSAVEAMGGVTGWTHSAIRVELGLDTTVQGWAETLRATVAHEYAHTVFLEATTFGPEESPTWKYVLFEAQSQQFAERVYPDVDVPWREAVDDETLVAWWPRVRDGHLDDPAADSGHLFFGSEDVPRWLGYSLSYAVGAELLADHGIEEFPELTRRDVVAAGNERFE